MQLALQNLTIVFSDIKYSLLAILIAFLYYAFNAFIGNVSLIISSFSSFKFYEAMMLYLKLFLGYSSTIKVTSFISLLLISALFGILFSMLIYRSIAFKANQKDGKLGLSGSIGVFLGALAPGCASCGLGFLPLLGISVAGIALLPFQGLELSITAIVILAFTIVKLSRGLTFCKISKI